MKLLKGSLRETLYNFPDQELVQRGVSAPITVKKETVYQENEVTYISGPLSSILYSQFILLTSYADQIGLHRISNPDPTNFAVSLHRTAVCTSDNSFTFTNIF
jgi:cysteine dioxygenase